MRLDILVRPGRRAVPGNHHVGHLHTAFDTSRAVSTATRPAKL